MAVMIPDRIPSRASAGEKRLFSVLQRLPDDNVVYYEPIIEDRYPDFILISPDLGVLVIEVKGWQPREILGGDNQNIQIKERSGTVTRAHPMRQAREYMYDLMNNCQQSVRIRRLIQQQGVHQNKLICPMSHIAILSNITEEQLRKHELGNLTVIFDLKRVVTRNVLNHWEEELHDSEAIVEVLKGYFDPWWSFPKLREDQIDALRAIIHPEIIISQAKVDEKNPETELIQENLKVLDLRQEENARNIGQGHRIIYGVAGSGKTVLLIARARLISQQSPESQVLFLCFNVALASYLKTILNECPNITITHFDGWAKMNGVVRGNAGTGNNKLEDNHQLGERLLAALQRRTTESAKYDAVLLDEVQDFDPSWFQCVLEGLKDPNDGDLIIVGDGSQGLYRSRKFTWKEVGVSARGRTISKNFDLDKNYRNSREIVELAALFAVAQGTEGEDGIASLRVEPQNCTRISGIKPVLMKSKNEAEECSKVVNVIRDLLNGNWFGQKIEPLLPQEIGVFYRVLGYKKDTLASFIKNLGEFAPVCWLNKDRASRTKVGEAAVKVQTIHSAKGLQYPAVIILWSGDMPAAFGDCTPQEERNLFYVALTRPENYLVISHSSQSSFVQIIEESGMVVVR